MSKNGGDFLLGPYNTSDYPITIVVVSLINIVVRFGQDSFEVLYQQVLHFLFLS